MGNEMMAMIIQMANDGSKGECIIKGNKRKPSDLSVLLNRQKHIVYLPAQPQ